ncbi:MAG: class I SAM-dependent methyltransferase [Candidatus Dadabacteria bacterium]|nr:MAG: class I SAM-dependent methyltransferase [Candidatus Dadabacteria bacterium]
MESAVSSIEAVNNEEVTLTSCPGCQSENLQFFIEQKASKHLKLNRVFKIMKCTDCTLRFVANPISAEELEKVYSANFFSTSQQTVPIDQDGHFTDHSKAWPLYMNSLRRVERIRKIADGGRLLDVGCARGYFLKIASEYFEVAGTDISKDACEYASSVLGLDVITGDFLTVPLEENAYDLVTMWDVLASIPKPAEAVARVSRILKTGGRFIFTVPDMDSLSFKILRHKWPLLIPPINMTYYNRRSVENLLKRNGFEIEQYKFEGKLLSVNFVLRKLGRIFNLPFLDSPRARIPLIRNVYLNLFDIATVYAVKKS